MVRDSLKEDLLHHIWSSQEQHLLKVSDQWCKKCYTTKNSPHLLHALPHEDLGVFFILVLAIYYLKNEKVVI